MSDPLSRLTRISLDQIVYQYSRVSPIVHCMLLPFLQSNVKQNLNITLRYPHRNLVTLPPLSTFFILALRGAVAGCAAFPAVSDTQSVPIVANISSVPLCYHCHRLPPTGTARLSSSS